MGAAFVWDGHSKRDKPEAKEPIDGDQLRFFADVDAALPCDRRPTAETPIRALIRATGHHGGRVAANICDH